MARKLFVHQLVVLWVEEVRELFGRRRSIVSLALYIGFLGLMFLSFRHLSRSVQQLTQQSDVRGHVLNSILEQLARLGLGQEAELLLAWPSSLLVFQILCVFWFPSLISLVSCDMISTDLHRGTIRYLMLRTSRSAYYVSKYLAHASVYALLQIASLLLLLVVSLPGSAFDIGTYLEAGISYTLVFLPFVLFLVAGTQFVSALCRRPATALIGVHLLWILLLALSFRFPFATPFHWRALLGLIVPTGEFFFDATVRMSAWAAGFFGVGWFLFSRREF